MKAVVIGSGSEIYQGIRPMLEADGWELSNLIGLPWSVCLVPMGRVAPVGNWWGLSETEFKDCVESNILKPVRFLTRMWPYRLPNASVCFFAGSNPQKPMAGYAPYHLGKMALLKTVEQLDFETPDAKFFALGPGYVPTSIHKATLEKNWPNERIARGDNGTPIKRIYECLKWCVSQPKEVVGGRNIAVSDPWENPEFIEALKANPSLNKLRRIEWR